MNLKASKTNNFALLFNFLSNAKMKIADVIMTFEKVRIGTK